MEKFSIKVNKLGESCEIDFDKLPATSKTYIVQYGLKQVLNDCVASKEGDEVGTTIARKLAALEDGSVRVSSAGRASDPLGKAAMDYAREVVRASIKAGGKQVNQYTSAQITEAASKILDTEDVKKEAARRVKAQGNEALSMADLGL